MELFEQIGKKVTDAGQGAAQQAKIVADIAKLSGMISERKKRVARLYGEVGKLYYEQHKDDPAAEEPDRIREITTLTGEIANARKTIKQLQSAIGSSDSGADGGSGAPMGNKSAQNGSPASFCTKCGKEIKNGSGFCTHCGAQIKGPTASSASTQPLQTAAAKVSPAVKSGMNWLSGNSAVVVPLAKAVAFVIMIFLWFSKLVSLSVLGSTLEFSMLDMSEGAEWLPYLTAVILVIGAVCSIFPGISRKLNIPMLASGWTAFWFIGSVLTASKQLGEYSSYEPEFTVTFAGWLLIILSVGMLVLTILETRKQKRARKMI